MSLFSIRHAFHTFWAAHPALLCGILLLLATGCGIAPHFVYPFLAALILAPLKKTWILLSLILFALGVLHTTLRCPLPSVPQTPLTGKGIFTIESLKTQHSPFHRTLVYRGKLDFTSTEGFTADGLPCAIYAPDSSKHPPASCTYEINGSLVQKGERFFIFKPAKKTPWTPLPNTRSLAEWRYRAKQSLNQFLRKNIPDSHARVFLNALSSGEIDDRILSLEFGKLGLQHILAISGFHFALIALCFGLTLRLFLPFRKAAILLLILLSAYSFFLGYSPSIFRAYLTVCFVLIGALIGRQTSALNALGAALIIELGINPLVITHTGFQLSFLCTLAILLLTPPCLHLFNFLLPKRSLKDLLTLSRLDQHGYLCGSYLRSALALNLAIFLATLPAILFLFHRFPLLSIPYNLFFSLCVGLSLILLCLGTLLSFTIPPLGACAHQLNSWWTGAILTLSQEPPALCDFVIRVKGLPFSAVALYLALLFMGAIYWNAQQKSKLFSL